MALPENRYGVVKLLEELSPLVIGRPYNRLPCLCGDTRCDARPVAREIIPAGDDYPGQEASWALWSVRVEDPHDPQKNTKCGLSDFLDVEDLRARFAVYFGDNKVIHNPYAIEVRGARRIYTGLPTAVKIRENDQQVRLSFDWGLVDQTVSELLYHAMLTQPRRKHIEDDQFWSLAMILRGLNPEVYRGGPDPELPFESTWHMDYDTSLNNAIGLADHVFLQNGGRDLGDGTREELNTHVDVVFMKVPVH